MVHSLLPLLFLVPIPDFSIAGCQQEISIQIPAMQVNVQEFGAIANDDKDDSEAIQNAINAVSEHGGTVVFPKGRFVIERRIEVQHNKTRLLGDHTTLYCPNSLTDVYGVNRNWSWSSGFLRLRPRGKSQTLGHIVANAPDGSNALQVEWEDMQPSVGEWIQLWWFNDTGDDTLFSWLYGDAVQSREYGKELQESKARRVVSWFKVTSVTDDSVELYPPLPMPAQVQWNVQVVRVPSLRYCIIENLHFDFKKTTYPGHLKEKGFNAIAGNALVECLFKNISTTNADSGIILGGSGFTTVDGFITHGRYMHHPICLSSCSHCLVQDFALNAPHRHGTTISWCSHFNVFTDGSGNELAMDSHKACSFRNLHQNITIYQSEQPKQPLRSGGSAHRGLHSARQNVYWNIKQIFPSEGEPFHISYLRDWPLGVFGYWYGNREIVMTPKREGQVILSTNIVPSEEKSLLYRNSSNR